MGAGRNRRRRRKLEEYLRELFRRIAAEKDRVLLGGGAHKW